MLRANCTLHIELDRPDRRYCVGDRVTGKLRVEVSDTVKCDGLTLSCQWRTHGSGNRASGPSAVARLFEGEWRPGTYTYPFDFGGAGLPATYRGSLLNIDWFLDAQADVPWAIDARSSTDFCVDLPEKVQAEVLPTQSSEMSAQTRALFSALFLIPLVIAGVFLVSTGVTQDSIGLLAFGALWLVVVAVIVVALTKNILSRQAFSRYATHLVHEAGHLVVHNSYATRKLVNGMIFTLIAEEVVVEGSGTDRRTYTEKVHSHAERIHIGRSGEHSCDIDLKLPDPRKVGWSFEATDNKLRWYVQVECDIENWPDLSETIPLQVSPRFVAGG